MGDSIQVMRDGLWQRATVLEVADDGFRVEYQNNLFPAETVTEDRMRRPPAK